MRLDPNPPRSDGWRAARVGILTASDFDKIVTPAKRQPSSSIAGLVREKAAEWALGCPLEDFSSGMTDRGSEMEAEAVAFYAGETGSEPVGVGLCLHDTLPVGASPDRLVGEDGLLEVKCPGPKAMVGYLLDPETLRAEYACQVQGQLWVTGRSWCDLYAWHPTLPPVTVRCARDEEFIAALEACARRAVEVLEDAKDSLRASGVVPPATLPDPNQPSPEELAFSESLREAAGVGVPEDGPPPPDLREDQLPF